MNLVIKYSICTLLLILLFSCENANDFQKFEILKNIDIKNHNVALLETDIKNNQQRLLVNNMSIKLLKDQNAYVLYKESTSKKYSIQILVDGVVEKELFFSTKPRWFSKYDLPQEPFEEFSFSKWMATPVLSSSNDIYAMYSRKDSEKFTYKEPHFINKYQGQIKNIEAEYFDNSVLWDSTHYIIKPSVISKELKRAYHLVITTSLEAPSLTAKIKIDRDSVEVLSWEKLAGISRKNILSEFNNVFREGNIIFQISKSSQSKAIQEATNSLYSHMGIIYKKGSNLFVYEAVQPVKFTPLNQWITNGENEHYVVKRLKNADKLLTKNVLVRMKENGQKYLGKDYDSLFEWSDSQMYCSELVWKIYKETLGIEIGKIAKLSDFNLSHPTVKSILKERYGNNIPMNEKVITPSVIYNSDKLETIFSD